MAFSDIAIRIGADFVGLPAFKKADTAVDKLYKSTKKLAAGFGVAFSAQAIARFGVTAVKAFAAEEKQIAALTTTVKNLGLAFTAPAVNDFIENLERATGIAREELQPAFQKLLTQTGSITKSQKILATAIEVSFSGLMSTSEAADVLTQAYVGNMKGLKSLNLGLTNAELASMSFDEILKKVSKTYKDQYNAALDTTQVKMDKFNVAVGNAIENVGGGLVDAFSKLAGSGDLDKANSKIEQFSLNLADIIRNFNGLTAAKFVANPLILLAEATVNKKPTALSSNVGKGGSYFTYKAQQFALAKAEKEARDKALEAERKRLELLRKQTAEKKAQILTDKANAAVAKAKSQFDLEGIQLAAALQNKTLTAEEKNRLEIKQKIWEIEQAQAAGDMALLETLLKQLEALMKQQTELAKLLAATNQLKSMFDLIGFDKKLIDTLNLQQALDLVKQINAANFATVSGGKALQGTSFAGYDPYSVLAYGADIAKVNPDMPIFAAGYSGYSGSAATPSQAAQDIYITAIIEGNVMSQNDLAEAIRQQIQDAQQSGKDVNWARQALPATFL